MFVKKGELPEAVILGKRLYEADPVGVIRAGMLEIRTKQGELKTLVPNSTQERVLQTIQGRRKRKRPVYLFVLKARQLGISTLAQALTFSFATMRPNINALDIADDIDGAEYIFKMNELFFERGKAKYPFLFPDQDRSSERRMELSNKSRIMIDTAGNSRAGRKFTLHVVHLSEVAFYKNFDEIMQALRPAIADAPDTIVILETTANGRNAVCKFYWKIKAAFEADPDSTDWVPMFCSWKEHKEYQRAFYTEDMKKRFEETLTAKERQIMKEHTLTLEQLNWRRRMIEDAFAGDVDKFEVEFPLTDREAFKSTSRRVFPDRLVEPQRPNIQKPKAIGEIVRSERRPYFAADPSGFLRVYQESKPEERYVIGADTCESALKFDEACAQVIRRSTWTQVAHLHGHIDPQDFAETLFALGLYYNCALVAPERNGPGLVTVTKLAEMGYPNICRERKSVVSDGGAWVETEEFGFHTNAKTKPVIIDGLQNALRTLLLVLHDQKTVDQLETYVVRNIQNEDDFKEKFSVQMGAEDGSHDDCVMALAIALHYARQLPEWNAPSSNQQIQPSTRITGY